MTGMTNKTVKTKASLSEYHFENIAIRVEHNKEERF